MVPLTTHAEADELKQAIDNGDFGRVREMLTSNPKLHAAPLGYNQNGPLTWVTECRVPRVAPSEDRLALAQWMIDHGSDLHQGGDGPLMRAALDDSRLPMTDLLLRNGANPRALWNGNYPIVFAPCETLAPQSLKLLIERGADWRVVSPDHGTCLGMLIGTYSRNAPAKRECLDLLARWGAALPESAPMAILRGRVDLLAPLIERDRSLLDRRFRETEIFPPEICGVGLHVAPLEGAMLLHLAVEYQELEIVEWLLQQGADANARSDVDPQGFGGHSPLFHTTVTLSLKSDDRFARLLLQYGADPDLRATFRKQLAGMGDGDEGKMREYHNVTAIEFARQFQVPAWVNESAIAAISAG